MSYYRIKSILHSGRKGERNTPRTDGKYPFRVNRIVEINDTEINDSSIYIGNIITGYPLIVHYVKGENGEDYSRFYLQTTAVKDWDFIYDGVIRVETLNTIYEFEKVERE